ncbi:hypothetical protein P7K49_024215 [Saguinus oedipus]|uniref:ASPIC/UnbV domain-containing protein n=1 Tax=Saguinus oedipus TaxID=9490 RepID=A0ABQ9UNW2_SAGOE|nr:hypothetical protein P7K49_024215 [Saguinus oedipus]
MQGIVGSLALVLSRNMPGTVGTQSLSVLESARLLMIPAASRELITQTVQGASETLPEQACLLSCSVIRREHGDPLIEELNPGDALEPEGRGTGGVVTDFDGDGMLDLILSHGESMAQPLSVFRGNQVRSDLRSHRSQPSGFNNNWLRVVPRTRFGAFARGAKVVLYTKKSGAHLRIIDGGSGYLCEMEPVAHFGLGIHIPSIHGYRSTATAMVDTSYWGQALL